MLVLTGANDESLGIAAVTVGALDYLVKGQIDGSPLNRSIRYAMERKRADGLARRLRETAPAQDQANLLLRIYIPASRLYASEAQRLLGLFRDWLIYTRGQGVRQSGYRTALGEMIELYADSPAVLTAVSEQLEEFKKFLPLCDYNPSAAIDLLTPLKLPRSISTELVERFGREVRRLEIDLRHERERRILTIRHDIEEQLVECGADLRAIPSGQIDAMLSALVPAPSAAESVSVAIGFRFDVGAAINSERKSADHQSN